MPALRPACASTQHRLARHTARLGALAGLATFATLSLADCTTDPGPVTVTTLAPPSTATEAPATETAAPATASAEPTTPAPVATAGPADDPADASAPFVADTLPDTETASAGAFLSRVNVRFGAHRGYDRIVLDLTGTPGWTAEYVTSPKGGAARRPGSAPQGAHQPVVDAHRYAANRSGRSVRCDSTWIPLQCIVDALDKVFYLASGVIEPAGKRTMVALDVSGSMSTGQVAGVPRALL